MNITIKLLAAAAALAIGGTVTAETAHAGVIVAPIDGYVTQGGTMSRTTLANAWNQGGLSQHYVSGYGDFDLFLAADPTHSIYFPGAEWFTSEFGAAMVTFDLGEVMPIASLALWNEEATGIGRLGLWASRDDVGYVEIGTFAPTDNPTGVDYRADRFDFAPVDARYVTFLMDQCGWNQCSIGEVAFNRVEAAEAAVPEPATWAMMLFGFGALGQLLRRRPQKALRVRYA